MRRVASLQIAGLFGYADHYVRFRQDAPTMLTAPNGAGKTHVLSLLRAALAVDFRTLFSTPFSTMRIDLIDGRSLSVTREVQNDAPQIVTIAAMNCGRVVGKPLRVDATTLESFEPRLPPSVRRAGPDRWYDSRSGRMLSRDAIERRFKSQTAVSPELLNGSPEVRDICVEPWPIFIDTKRLDLSAIDTVNFHDSGSSRPISGAASRIHDYTDQLRLEVSEARRGSVYATQSADLSFAARALAAARKTVKEADLHERYDRTVERYEALARNSLAVGEAPLAFPEQTTPTVRRILSVFLDDWDKRLEPLLPLNEKIQTLREILDSKLEPSGKTTTMSPRGGLEFRTHAGNRIRVSSLSSGEQHLVALFTMLLFSAKPGSLVLIDEPEISLHAAWKHAFLEDISRVARVSNLQVVMATHSSAIINGRWDLAEELVLARAPDRLPDSTDSVPFGDDDDVEDDE